MGCGMAFFFTLILTYFGLSARRLHYRRKTRDLAFSDIFFFSHFVLSGATAATLHTTKTGACLVLSLARRTISHFWSHFFITSVMAEAQKRFRYNWAWKKTKGGFGHYRLGVLRCAYSFLDFCFLSFPFFCRWRNIPRGICPQQKPGRLPGLLFTREAGSTSSVRLDTHVYIIQGQRRRNAKKRHGTGHVGDAARTQDTPPFLASVDCTIVFLQMQIKTYTSKVGLETNTRWQLPLYYKFLDPTSYFLNQSWRLQHLVESFAGETPDSGPCRLG